MERKCSITAEQLVEILPIGEWIECKGANQVALSLVRRVGGKFRHVRHINDLMIELELAKPPRVALRTMEASTRNSQHDLLITGVKRLT